MDFTELFIDTILWATAATLISQTIGVGIMWWLGVPPKKLTHEIEDVQNVAVGATFFIVALISAAVIGMLTAEPSAADSATEDIAWIAVGLALATAYTIISFVIVNHVFGRIEGESTYTYIRRELVTEQNAALAFFLGGLASTHFISVFAHII